MNKRLKIFLIIIGILVIVVGGFFYKLLGYPYLRFQLLGTEYVENSTYIDYLSELNNEPYYLIKKYKYSKDVMLIGFGGGSSRTNDYYGLGLADKNKKEILPPIYEFLYIDQDFKTKAYYIHCVPFRKTGHEPDEYYIITGSKATVYKKTSFK